MSIVATYSFECVPSDALEHDYDRAVFDSFLMDVPSMSGEDYAARRAWWTAFHKLGAVGWEPEDFAVYEYRTIEGRGRQVGAQGFMVAA